NIELFFDVCYDNVAYREHCQGPSLTHLGFAHERAEALFSSNSACSTVLPGPPGRADSAPSSAVLQIVATVVRSIRHFSAASRCVHGGVNTATYNSYFWLGANRR